MSSPSANSKLNYKHHLAPLFNSPVDLPPSPWMGHIPFMFVLFQALKPKSYVELGVHNGCSFLAAASAAALYAPDCRLTGIDTWQGDDHAVYGGGDAILAKLSQTVDAHFTNVTLVRDFFDHHAPEVAVKSVDLLHIDGLHTYEAVKHDFETWLPKMADNGVVIFHDTEVYDKDFGVYQFFDELSVKYPHFKFKHSFGLGVIFLGKTEAYPESLMVLADNPDLMADYANLVFDVASSLEVRFLANQRCTRISSISKGSEDQATIIIPGSRSWKLIMLLRRLRRLF